MDRIRTRQDLLNPPPTPRFSNDHGIVSSMPVITPEVMIKTIVDAVEIYVEGPNVVQLTDTNPLTKMLVEEITRRKSLRARSSMDRVSVS